MKNNISKLKKTTTSSRDVTKNEKKIEQRARKNKQEIFSQRDCHYG